MFLFFPGAMTSSQSSAHTDNIIVEDSEVEVLNTSEHPEKITKVSANNEETENGLPPEFKDTSIGKLFENMEELKKIRGFFMASVLLGFTGLFFFHLWLGIAAIAFGIADIQLGSKITRKAAYTGIVLGVLAIILHVS